MPKKSALKKKAERSPPDDLGPPPPEMVAELANCLTQFAESVEERLEVLCDAPMEVPTFRGFGGQAARAVLANVPGFDGGVLSKLEGGETRFLMPEVATIARAVADHLPRATGPEQLAMMMTGMAVIESVQTFIDEIDEELKPESPKQPKTDEIYQLKITLLNVEPAIWRRIQIRDCTLADLHYLIQAAMGWEDAHLYEFQVNRKRYVVPLDAADWDVETEDPNRVLLSELLPEGRKQLKFKYLYDFGDDWWHEVRFEKRVAPTAKIEYPVCNEGEGACPPEDSGGPWGYLDLLEALGDKDHPKYEDARDWLGPRFDPKGFNPKKATSALRESAAYVAKEPRDDDEDFGDEEVET
jgi:hypothetical protein